MNNSAESKIDSLHQYSIKKTSFVINTLRAGASFQHPSRIHSSPEPVNKFSLMRSSKNSGTESIKSNSDLNWVEPISIGFIGCGTIASAIATGLASQKTCPIPISSISVTKRSESKSKKLLSSFPDLVTVYDNDDAAQSVVDSSDIVFLCVLPEQVDTVLNKVCFDTKRHTLVSLLVSTHSLHFFKFFSNSFE